MIVGCYGGIYEGEKQIRRLVAYDTRHQTCHTPTRGKTRDTAGDPKYIKPSAHNSLTVTQRGADLKNEGGTPREGIGGITPSQT